MNHCGACDNRCNPSQYCGNGVCVVRGGVDLTPVDQGWRSNVAAHSASNNFLALGSAGTSDYRGFIIFDPESIQGRNVQRVALRLAQDLYSSVDDEETITVRAFAGNQDALVAAGENVALFNELGAGTVVGTGVVTEATIGRVLEITFNAQGVAFVNQAQSNIAFSLSLSLSNRNDTEFVRFGTSMNGSWLRINGGP